MRTETKETDKNAKHCMYCRYGGMYFCSNETRRGRNKIAFFPEERSCEFFKKDNGLSLWWKREKTLHRVGRFFKDI